MSDLTIEQQVANSQAEVRTAQAQLATICKQVGTIPYFNGQDVPLMLWTAVDQLARAQAKSEVYTIMSGQDFYHAMMISAGAEPLTSK